MIPEATYCANLELVARVARVEGCVIECGVWRGGMIAGMAKVLGTNRDYFLFDSFEGLPPAREVDGEAARIWQSSPDAPSYHDNCRAEAAYAEQAMAMAGAVSSRLIKGWFDATLPDFVAPKPIAVLRLDADWYESTMICLKTLFHQVAPGGIVLIDDYYTWEGCSKAVHEFLAATKSSARIDQLGRVCFIQK